MNELSGSLKKPQPYAVPYGAAGFPVIGGLLVFKATIELKRELIKIGQAQMLQRSLFLGDSTIFFFNKCSSDCFKPLIFQGSEKVDLTILLLWRRGFQVIFNSQVSLTSPNH